ncbi:hypothetical protein IQ268_22655 [Oculatella sp. LEGE 06141]|uniref:hypothetical protein n=1 Tax=Oculatella sp. LEGE 06141 TaxID=1828648 RepID=UPI0018817C30|nr:hypothetical protein [Oculatella sp. LEGE 06141]MBE9181366.1 hypothetical protein [Oculatella sp. LEGE 06141]
MTYRKRLQPWCIIRHLPNAQSVMVARFRQRGEAEAYLKTLCRLTPQVSHSLVFDPISDASSAATPSSPLPPALEETSPQPPERCHSSSHPHV